MKRIIVDTNLLVLLVIGCTDEEIIKNHKRTRKYEKEDFSLLKNILSGYGQVIVTPHIVTETSNLISQIADPPQSELKNTLHDLLRSQKEDFEASLIIMEHDSFTRFGVTDCAIIRLLGVDVDLITDDLNLYLEAMRYRPLNTFNFEHFRGGRLLGFK